MKKYYGILLLACLSLPVLGTYTWLQYRKSCVKQELRRVLNAGMSKERLVRLAFTAGQVDTLLRWEHDKEFEYQKQMYDVLEQAYKGDSIVFWCWWDQEETLLNLQLEELVQKAFAQDPLRKHSEKQLSYFFKTLYCDFPQQLNRTPFAFQSAARKLIFAFFSLRSINPCGPPSPPPQMV